MKIMSAAGRNRSALVVMILFATAVMLAITLCMGCSSTEETTGSDHTEETAGSDNAEASADTAETPASPEEEVTVQPEATQAEEVGGAESAETEAETEGQEAAETEDQEAGIEDSVESEVTEDADEWIALYNDYKNQGQGALAFTEALCEADYDKICLVNEDGQSINYFSVKDGNYHIIPEGKESVLLYVPYIPTEFSCDNENIEMHYWYKEQSNAEDYLINIIHLYCPDFEGDDVPVNISVTFEDGSTQEITVYLTSHAE